MSWESPHVGPPILEPIYTADWWRRFFNWERSVQLEFVQDAVERGLGLEHCWGDKTWGDVREASDNGGTHSIPQPFDVRHMMVMLCGNRLFNEDGGIVLMVDMNGHHDELRFCVAGMNQKELERLHAHAEERLKAEYPWVWGWREHCWETDEAVPDEKPAPPTPASGSHGNN